LDDINDWDKKVIKAIITTNTIGITEIFNYKPLKSVIVTQNNYPSIVNLINKKDWESLSTIQDADTDNFREYIDIIKFSNQSGTEYVATVYDSDELWQDPVIKEITTYA